jgi:FkbM family methyltransferase
MKSIHDNNFILQLEHEIKEKLCISEIQSNSQLNQDLFVLILKNFKTNGIFVEFGVCDGIFLSNSFILEKKYNWSGVVCEPLKSFQPKLSQNRNCSIDHRAVYSSSNLTVEFREISGNEELSGICSSFLEDNLEIIRNENYISYQVETISLTDLLDDYNIPVSIDFISIDTEGSEFDILSNFNFDKYDVDIFTVEHNYIHSKREEIKNLMEKNHYTRILTDISQWDDWYVSNKFLNTRN